MSILGDAIRAGRLSKGLTQQQLGAEFKISKAAVAMWESGTNVPDQRKLARLVQLLGLDPSVAVGLEAPPESPLRGLSEGPQTIMTIQERGFGEKPDLPVYASAQGGDGALILTRDDPVDWLYRSEQMRSVRNPFAFMIIGDSMAPALEHGDRAVVNPSIVPRPNVNCVFVQEVEDSTSFLVLTKRLLRSTADVWRVRQFNPARDFDLSRRKWSKAHVISEIRKGGL